jgi:hypothetical protein
MIGKKAYKNMQIELFRIARGDLRVVRVRSIQVCEADLANVTANLVIIRPMCVPSREAHVYINGWHFNTEGYSG